DELVEAIKAGRIDELELPPRTRALCDIAWKLSGEPTKMVEEDWQPLRDLGFDDRGIMEVAHVVSIVNYFTRLADGLGLQLAPWMQEAIDTGVRLDEVPAAVEARRRREEAGEA